LARYRYRTSAIVGPWRRTREQAAADAVNARQARWDETGAQLRWTVPGDIEEERSQAAA
jgi:hypothetical protein